ATRACRGPDCGPRQHCAHGCLERLLWIEGIGLQTRNRSDNARFRRKSVATGQSRCRLAEALAPGNSPRRGSTQPSGLLLGRIHLQVQSPHFWFARIVVLSPFGPGSAFAARAYARFKGREAWIFGPNGITGVKCIAPIFKILSPSTAWILASPEVVRTEAKEYGAWKNGDCIDWRDRIVVA